MDDGDVDKPLIRSGSNLKDFVGAILHIDFIHVFVRSDTEAIEPIYAGGIRTKTRKPSKSSK